MVRLFLAVITVGLIVGAAMAQGTPDWVATYNGPAGGADYNAKVAVDGSGNCYVTGSSAGGDTGDDIVTIKYDAAGRAVWTARWTSALPGGSEAPAAIAVDGQGNIVVAGTTWNDLNVNGTGGTEYDFITLKYSPEGALLWERRYDGPIHWQDLANCMTLDAQGNVIVGGQSHSRAPADHPLSPGYLNFDFTVVKYDGNGNLLWDSRYHGPDYRGEGVAQIACDALGNIVATGTTGVWRGGDTEDLLTVKYDPNGNVLWMARNLGAPGMRVNGNVPRRVRVDRAGNVYVAGWDAFGVNGRDVLVLKYSPSGALLWKRVWGRELEDVVYDAELDGAGNLVVAVSTEPIPGKGFPDSDALLLKYDPNGVLLWERFYNGPDNLWDGDNVVVVDGAGNVYMGLQSQSVTYDYTVLKYTPAGSLEWVWKYDGPARRDDNLLAMALDGAGNLYVSGGSVNSLQNWDLMTLRLPVSAVSPAPAMDIASVAVSPTSVTGGQTATGTVTLNGPAPAGGASLRLSSSNTDIAILQGFVDIPAGQAQGSFRIETSPGRPPATVTISATYNGKTVGAPLAVGTNAPAVTLSGLTLSPSSVTGGGSVTGTVVLSGAAPAGGVLVTLSSGTTAVATLPTSVLLPAGATSAMFTVTSKSVAASTPVTISGSYGGTTRSATLTVSPAAAPPPPSADTVAIQQAEYTTSKKQLRVQATSTSASATLKVYVTSTGALIGTLANNGGGRYSGQLGFPSNPQNVTIRSDKGGSTSRAVTVK